MSVEDFQINAFVRQVLSRAWIDLQAVKYGTIGATVYFHGRFEKERPKPHPDRPWEQNRLAIRTEDIAILERVEKEIRRNPAVKDIVFRFENFRKSRGSWSVVVE